MKKKERCNTCIYRTRPGSPHKCDYFSMTGHTRRAVPAHQCEHYKKDNAAEGQAKRRVKPDWDAAMELYKQGLTDPEIAERIGCSKYAIFKWRKRNGLQTKYRNGKEQNHERTEP